MNLSVLNRIPTTVKLLGASAAVGAPVGVAYGTLNSIQTPGPDTAGKVTWGVVGGLGAAGAIAGAHQLRGAQGVKLALALLGTTIGAGVAGMGAGGVGGTSLGNVLRERVTSSVR